MPNTVETDWDEGSPILTQPRKAGAAEINSLRKGVRLRLAREHETLAAAGAGGEHKAGSAKAYHQAAAPTLRPDGSTSLAAGDAGRLWVDTDDGSLWRYNGTSWVEVKPVPLAAAAVSVNSAQVNSASGWSNGNNALAHVFITASRADTGSNILVQVDHNDGNGWQTVGVSNLIAGFRFVYASVMVPRNGKVRLDTTATQCETYGQRLTMAGL